MKTIIKLTLISFIILFLIFLITDSVKNRLYFYGNIYVKENNKIIKKTGFFSIDNYNNVVKLIFFIDKDKNDIKTEILTYNIININNGNINKIDIKEHFNIKYKDNKILKIDNYNDFKNDFIKVYGKKLFNKFLKETGMKKIN